MNEDIVLIGTLIGIVSGALTALLGHYVSLRRIPTEKTAVEAAARATEAGADKVIADTIALLQKTIGEMQNGKSLLDNEFFELRITLSATVMEVERLKIVIEKMTAELTSSRAETLKWQKHAEALEVAINGFPAEIKRLEALVARQDAAARQVAETQHADALTRRDTASAALKGAEPDAPLKKPGTEGKQAADQIHIEAEHVVVNEQDKKGDQR